MLIDVSEDGSGGFAFGGVLWFWWRWVVLLLGALGVLVLLGSGVGVGAWWFCFWGRLVGWGWCVVRWAVVAGCKTT